MKTSKWFAIGTATLCLSLGVVASADSTIPALGLHHHDSQRMAITGATLVTEPGKRIANATLILDHGKIVQLGKNLSIPAGTRVVDAGGRWIYPGFIDLYSDYGMPAPEGDQKRARGRPAPKYRLTRPGGRYWNSAVHAAENWVDRFQADDKVAKAYRKLGFTAVQSARLDGIFRGRSAVVSLAGDLATSIYRAHSLPFVSFDKGSSPLSYPNSLMGSMALIRQTLSDARWYRRARKSRDLRMIDDHAVTFDTDLDALAKLPEQGFLFAAGDVQSELRAHRLLAEFKLPAVILGDGQEYAWLDEIKASGRSFILPLTFPKAPETVDPGDALALSLAALRRWERSPTNPGALERAGVAFALTRHGLKKPDRFWPNLRTAVRYGLSSAAALAALTTTPAAMLGLGHEIGALRVGMRANFILATAELFQHRGRVAATWIDGQRYDVIDSRRLRVMGEYTFSLEQRPFTLKIEDQGKKGLKVSLTRDQKTVQATGKIQFNALKASFAKPIAGLKNAPRLVLYADPAGLHGRLLGGIGEAFVVRATRVAVTDGKSSTPAEKTPPLHSHLTHPLAGFGRSEPPTTESLLIRDATVWTSGPRGNLQHADVLVSKGHFEKIGQGLKAPRGYRVINAHGKHLTAGIIDEHSHIAISHGVNEGSEAITAEVRIADVVDAEDINIYRGLAGGKTVSHLLHGSANPIGGQLQVIKLRWGEDAEGLKYAKAPPTIKFALGENVKQSNWGDDFTLRYPQTRMGVVTLMRDAFNEARAYDKRQRRWAGMGQRKRRGMAPPRIDYRLQALGEVVDGRRLIHVHSYVASEILALMDLAESQGFRIQTFTHILEGYKVAPEMAAHGAMASTFADWWAYKFEVYDAIPQNTCLMHDAGVVTSVNSDSGDLQRRLNVEAAKSVTYCGMSQRDAWDMVTINPAKQLRIEQWTGSIEKGKEADFVIWNANPLSVYARVEQTWIDGRLYFDHARQTELEGAIVAERAALLQEARKSAGRKDQRAAGEGHESPQPAADRIKPSAGGV